MLGNITFAEIDVRAAGRGCDTRLSRARCRDRERSAQASSRPTKHCTGPERYLGTSHLQGPGALKQSRNGLRMHRNPQANLMQLERDRRAEQPASEERCA